MAIYKFLVQHKTNDPRNTGYLHGAHALGISALQSINLQDLYFIESQLSQEELQLLALKLLRKRLKSHKLANLRTINRIIAA